jgi:hypothetical protein
MFGYKTLEVKTPNLKSRPFWNYIKTVNVNITGMLPEEDRNKLSAIFDSGVTIWHDAYRYLDYTQNNHS